MKTTTTHYLFIGLSLFHCSTTPVLAQVNSGWNSFVLEFFAWLVCSWFSVGCVEEEDDPCGAANNPCQNGGSCSSLSNNDVTIFSCQCLSGFTGDHCQTVIDGIASMACTQSLDRATMDDFVYTGAFRLPDQGEPGINYAVGVMAFNSLHDSIYIVGHSQYQTVAEFPVPVPGRQATIAALPVAASPRQDLTPLLELAGGINGAANPQGLNMITGMLHLKDTNSILVNCENWYDSSAVNTETTAVVPDANHLASVHTGFLSMTGGAQSAGYMGRIPSRCQAAFGKDRFYSGWSTVHSIVSRYSVGPSLWTFDGANAVTTPPGTIHATSFMNYGYCSGCAANATRYLSDRALDWSTGAACGGPYASADPLWNPLSRAVYGFFVPHRRTFAAIGSTQGLSFGIGYKCHQSNGDFCDGPCPYHVNDVDNYYWLFDIDDILQAEHDYDPVPYAYGVWDIPFDDSGHHRVIGATLDDDSGTLYVALSGGAQLGEYDVAPLIVTFQLPNN